jgi:integrase
MKRFQNTEPPTTVKGLAQRIESWAESYYTRAAYYNVRDAMNCLRAVAGRKLIEELDADVLYAVQQREIERGISRRIINDRINLIRRCCKWAASPPRRWLTREQIHDLQLIEGLRRGRTEAPEGKGIQPVDWADVQATIEAADATGPGFELARAIEVHWHTGMRPGELVGMKWSEIDASRDDVWIFTPAEHKNAHRGHTRQVIIPPAGIEALTAWRKRCPKQRDRVWRFLTPNTYRQAIGRTNDRIVRQQNQVDEKIGGTRCKDWGWTPAQIRHSFATKVYNEVGAEAARVLLGHRNVKTSEIYAEAQLETAMKAIAKLG